MSLLIKMGTIDWLSFLAEYGAWIEREVCGSRLSITAVWSGLKGREAVPP